MWFVYIILTKNNKLYTGITTDPRKRFLQHEEGTGAKFLKSNPPKKFVFIQKSKNRSEASKLEATIKKLTRPLKNNLIKENLKKTKSLMNKLS